MLPILKFRILLKCSQCNLQHISYKFCDVDIVDTGYHIECQCSRLLYIPFHQTYVSVNEEYLAENRRRLEELKMSGKILNSPRFQPVLDSLFKIARRDRREEDEI